MPVKKHNIPLSQMKMFLVKQAFVIGMKTAGNFQITSPFYLKKARSILFAYMGYLAGFLRARYVRSISLLSLGLLKKSVIFFEKSTNFSIRIGDVPCHLPLGPCDTSSILKSKNDSTGFALFK